MQQNAEAVNSNEMQTLKTSQSDYLILETEIRLEANMLKLAELEIILKEYLDAKRNHEELLDKVDADKQLLEVLSKLRNGVPMSSSIRVLRSESHTEMKPREQKKLREVPHIKVPWTNYAVDILTSKRKFMDPNTLFADVIRKFNVEKTYVEQGRDWRPGYIRWGIIHNCWGANAEASAKGNARGKLVEIEGRMGLRDWVTDDMKLRPEFVVAR